MTKITIAHSPDSDDIFMYYAIAFGWVDSNDIKFKNIALDIESLNKSAIESKYLISAISFALYPFIKNEYALLNTAMSFGDGYGPKLVKKAGEKLKNNFKVALSGEYTTNAMLFKIKYPNARIIYKNFLEIENSVIEGEVDAGVLIHESILNFNPILEVEANLWDIWVDLIEDNLPLPLGGMVLLRSIPILRAIECQNMLSKAAKLANKNKKLLCKMLENKVRIKGKDLEKYLDMYANEDSIHLKERNLIALDKLFELGYKNGFYKKLIKTKDYLIPQDYEKLRFS